MPPAAGFILEGCKNFYMEEGAGAQPFVKRPRREPFRLAAFPLPVQLTAAPEGIKAY